MAAREHRDSCRFSSHLSSAFSEWILIILLFLDAFLSYMVTKFARFCNLQTPCLLCSRLDHILGGEKPGFYKDLLCNAHKSEISSLAYCHVHRKLADVQEMCEGCLLSFATTKNSNPKTCKSSMDKLGVDTDEGEIVHLKLPAILDGDRLRNNCYGDDMVIAPLLKKDLEPGSLCTKQCLCCSDPFRIKPHSHLLLQRRRIEGDIAESGISLSRLHHLDGLNKRRGKSSQSPPIYHLGNHGFDHLSHVGYSELKITSDSESELPFSDDDDGSAKNLKIEPVDRCLPLVPISIIPKGLSPTLSDDTLREKLIQSTPIVSEPSLIVPEMQLQVVESRDQESSLTSTVAIGHGLEEINWSQIEVRTNSPEISEIISEQPQAPNEASNAKYDAEIDDVAQISTTPNGESTKALISSDMNSEASQITNDPAPSMHISMDLNDSRKLVIGKKCSSPSPTSTEIVTGKESARANEDLRLLLSQISAARGLELPWNDMSPSPRVRVQGDESKSSNVSSNNGSYSNSKRHSLETNDSSLESLYGIASEVEGESAVDRLKRQVDLDRKSMSILFKELEEERSASAIAANQAMAMINRLQEEKAAMQMEALQYQRMMEEQAEYDQEALEKLNDLLSEREKEIQDIEAEVDSYRKRFGEEPLGDSLEYNRTSTPRSMRFVYRNKSDRSLDSGLTGSRLMKDTLLDVEDEKAYISECLQRLKKKLHQFSINGEEGLPPSDDIKSEDLVEDSQIDVSEEKKDSSLSIKDLSFTPPSLGAQFDIKERRMRSSSSNNIQYPIVRKASDAIVIGDEVSQLNERLEALESDRDFLDRAINSLRNENDGVQFIREIACHLRELRRIGIRLRKHMVT